LQGKVAKIIKTCKADTSLKHKQELTPPPFIGISGNNIPWIQQPQVRFPTNIVSDSRGRFNQTEVKNEGFRPPAIDIQQLHLDSHSTIEEFHCNTTPSSPNFHQESQQDLKQRQTINDLNQMID
jgi:hypothetical protein